MTDVDETFFFVFSFQKYIFIYFHNLVFHNCLHLTVTL